MSGHKTTSYLTVQGDGKKNEFLKTTGERIMSRHMEDKMRENLFRTPSFLFAALVAAFILTWNIAPASSAVLAERSSDTQFTEQAGPVSEGAFLAKGQRKTVDDFPTVPRNRGRFGHPQPHGLIDNARDVGDLAKVRRRVDDNPGDDAPKRHFGPHNLMEDSSYDESVYAKVKRRVDDNPMDDNPRPHIGPHHLMKDSSGDELVYAKAKRRVDDDPKPHPRRGHG